MVYLHFYAGLEEFGGTCFFSIYHFVRCLSPQDTSSHHSSASWHVLLLLIPWEVWLDIYLNWFPSGKSLGCDNSNPHWSVGFKYNALQTVFQRKEILCYRQLLIKIIWFSQSVSLRWKWRGGTYQMVAFTREAASLNTLLCPSAFESCVLWCIWNQNSVREKEECQTSGFAHADLLQLCGDIFRGTCSTF